MERRQLGQTDMHVSVLGFGGAEIGYEGATAQTVEQLLNSALDAGLNVIDTAECYATSEELIGQTISHRRAEFFSSPRSVTRAELAVKIGRRLPFSKASSAVCAA